MEKTFDVDAFLEEAYRRDKKRTRSAIDYVFRTVSDLFDGLDWERFDNFMEDHGAPRIWGDKAGDPKFETINEILRKVDLDRLSDTLKISFLSITCTCKDKLSEFRPYFKRVEKHFNKARPEDTKALLQGFDR